MRRCGDRSRCVVLFLALVSSTAFTASASAQVNTERLRAWASDGFGGNLELFGTWRTGNVDLLELGFGGRMQYARLAAGTSTNTPIARQDPVDLVYLIGNLTFGIRSDQRFKNEGFAHLRWTHMFNGWLGSETFAQLQSNEFISLKQRVLAGGGVRFEPYEAENFEAAVGVGVMFEYERLDVAPDNPDDPETYVARSTNYVAVKFYTDDDGLSLIETLYVQPRLGRISDYRVLSESELAVKVGSIFSLALSVSLRFDNAPPTGVERFDSTVVNRFRFSF